MSKQNMLGLKIKCKITGMTGTAIARIEYINGCVQYQIQPKKLKDGVPVEAKWFDEEQLEAVVATRKVRAKRRRTGGPPPTSVPHRGR